MTLQVINVTNLNNNNEVSTLNSFRKNVQRTRECRRKMFEITEEIGTEINVKCNSCR